MIRDRRDEFQPVFYPHSIAVVGSFSAFAKGAYRFLRNLKNAGFTGTLYPVSPSEDEVFGLKCYHSLTDIPGPVDYVNVCIPFRSVLPLMDECIAKRVRVVQFFTAGFSESGTEEGRRVEEEVLKKARQGGFRIIGPNCIGVYSPRVRQTAGPLPFVGEVGDISLVVQSGGHTGQLVKGTIAAGIGLSKGVSFGNGTDLDAADYLEYYGGDPETKVIGAYLEGVRRPRLFFNVLCEVSATKPVVMLKGGRTTAGAIMAASHTASLATAYTTWSAAMKQANAIPVRSINELVDTLVALDRLPPAPQGRVAVISGLAAGGGGDSVYSADICLEEGLALPAFTPSIRKELETAVNWPGTIHRNPLDLSALGGSLDHLSMALRTVAGDPLIDAIILQAHIDDICVSWKAEGLEAITDAVIAFARSKVKPIVLVLAPGLAEPERLKAHQKLTKAGIGVFTSIERAARGLSNAAGYWRGRG